MLAAVALTVATAGTSPLTPPTVATVPRMGAHTVKTKRRPASPEVTAARRERILPWAEVAREHARKLREKGR